MRPRTVRRSCAAPSPSTPTARSNSDCSFRGGPMSELISASPGASVGTGVGLVLAGGGARGAYQAGAVRYLAECGIHIRMICGASIGALNGAVVACGPDL